jgi:hypothetical protein
VEIAAWTIRSPEGEFRAKVQLFGDEGRMAGDAD